MTPHSAIGKGKTKLLGELFGEMLDLLNGALHGGNFAKGLPSEVKMHNPYVHIFLSRKLKKNLHSKSFQISKLQKTFLPGICWQATATAFWNRKLFRVIKNFLKIHHL